MLYKGYSPTKTLKEALSLLAGSERAIPIAGGTDLMVQIHSGRRRDCTLVDIQQIPELKKITRVGDDIAIGAAATYQEIIASELLNECAWLLVEASTMVGASQIQHMGTIGGNIVNASPAGDLLPPLYTLEAKLIIESLGSQRIIPIQDFITGPGCTQLQPGELVREIRFKALPNLVGSSFVKFGLRQSQAISVVSVACIIRTRNEVIEQSRIALGAVGPTVIRCKSAEEMLHGCGGQSCLFDQAGSTARKEAKPIDDIRGSAAFRRYLVQPLVKRALVAAWDRVIG